MTKAELERVILKGEGLTVEFKLCKNGLTNSVFETVSSFSNRYGGHIILGVDDSGKIIGVNKNSVPDIKNNFIHTLNNPQRFSPTQFFSLEEVEINGKLLLWAYIPVNSQVVMFAGKIYDRAEGGDKIITENWNLPKHYGTINPKNFTPYPKNPILANFFVNIGRADSLGSGVRNLYNFSKIYSGKEPTLVEDDIFKTFIPITLDDKMDDKSKLSDKKYTEKILVYVNKNGAINAAIAAKIIGCSQTTAKRILKNLVHENTLNAVGRNKNRKYTSDKMDDKMDDKKYAEKILTYVDKNAEIITAIAAKIIGRSQTTAKRILKNLVFENILNIVGENKNRKYMRKKQEK